MLFASRSASGSKSESSADDAAAEADGNSVGPRAGLELRQEMPDVALDRLLGEEEPLTDLAVHEAVRDQLKNFDLPGGRLLLELLERSRERDDLTGAARRPPLGDGLEAPRVVHVARQDLFPLGSVHDPPIGRLWTSLTPPF